MGLPHRLGRFDDTTSTFIIETTEETFLTHGLDKADTSESIAFCEKLFAETLEGAPLMTNARHLRGSAWLNFNRLICERWSHFNGKSHVVLMGDAAHTAHFAIGSGTKLAIDDGIELARQFERIGHDAKHIPQVLEAYEDIRRIDVARIQNAARNAMEWFEVVGRRYADTLDPEQFMYSMLTRSQRISHENLRLRDPKWLEGFEHDFAQKAKAANDSLPPALTPFTARGVTLANRIVVSPMAMYSAVSGVPADFHLVHLGARAMGGAALVFAEMTCVSADARITPGCLGLWDDAQTAGFKRIADFIHQQTPAKFGIQLGHAGRKGATRVAWDGIDEPLASGAWPLISASPLPYLAHSQTPKAMDRADMDRVRDEFVSATRMADRAGFDIIELHAAHGYLISSFISPKSNSRTDEYGGSLENRLRYPLEVFRAMRAAWPAGKPMSVRISANDWVGDEGVTPAEAVEIARAFRAAGADIIDVSAGQTSTDARPIYGRMFQTPFSDRIRNETGIATMAVGNIYEPDHVNSILMAGRADLVCLARPHLADPYWTLHAAIEMGDSETEWPLPYLNGRDQARRLRERAQETIRV